jgi:hypothetical protein
MVEGEVWRDEWIGPAANSVRLRGDDVPPTAFFITDVQGNRESRATLRNEDVGKWLWFRSGVILAILERRGAKLTWYTSDTGGIEMTAGYCVHFGVNQLGLVNAYAHDVAKLSDWQQNVWAGFNVAPDGRVSDELLAAQVRAVPAGTQAPEEGFALALSRLDDAFAKIWGQSLFREHPAKAKILRTVHRFRAGDRAGLLALAKDVARLTADSFDLAALHRARASSAGEPKGTLKALERVLASIAPPELARRVMTALAGIYDMRLGDAHLPSSQLEDAFALVGIDPAGAPIHQAIRLLLSAAASLNEAADIIDGGAPSRP